jgi:hypothetical protein
MGDDFSKVLRWRPSGRRDPVATCTKMVRSLINMATGHFRGHPSGPGQRPLNLKVPRRLGPSILFHLTVWTIFVRFGTRS